MKIALNIEVVGARRGGAEKYAATLARALSAAGHEVHVLARLVDPGELPPAVRVRLVQPRPIPGLGWLRTYRFARASEAILRQESFDLIVGMVKVWYQHAYIALAGTHPGTLEYNSERFRSAWARRLWWLSKLGNPKQWAFRVIARRQFGSHHRPQIVAPSRMVAEHFHYYHGVPFERISVVYNALDDDRDWPQSADARREFRSRHHLGDDQVAVLFAAHNYSMKGLAPLLEAFAPVAARQTRARLVVCGSPRDARYRRQARSLGIEDRVLFLGFVDDMRECFAGCDLFAFPTFYDPCSLVVLEALAAGLPVITTRQNGAGELLDEGRDGYVIQSPWALDELGERLERLISDDALRQTMATQARTKVASCGLRNRMSELWTVLERAAGDPLASPRVRNAA